MSPQLNKNQTGALRQINMGYLIQLREAVLKKYYRGTTLNMKLQKSLDLVDPQSVNGKFKQRFVLTLIDLKIKNW
jgi:hypothetical protein